MTTPEVVYISKQLMISSCGGPYFGMTLYSENRILIRDDLPKIVQKSVLAHEQNHLVRGDGGSFWKNEPPAWWAGFKGQPLGFFIAIFLSMSPSRIKLYLSRIFANK